MTRYNYVIFHKNCIDGFSGFVILENTGKIDTHAKIYPDVPSAQNPPLDVDNKNVIIIDVAYKYEILKEIVNRAKFVTFIDHHVSIHDDVLKLESETNYKSKLKIIYNEKESGASLAWKYFYPKQQLPLFVRYVKDNDIGTWKLKHTHSFIASLDAKFDFSLTPENIKKWSKLFHSEIVKKYIIRGRIYWEYIEYLLNIYSKKYSMEAFPSVKIYEEYSTYFTKPAQYKVAVVCGSGCPNTTWLGMRILDTVECDFVIIWTLVLDRKEYVLSFRSRDVDVGQIAKLFGGGGHKLASACSFSVNKYSIMDLFMSQSLPRQAK